MKWKVLFVHCNPHMWWAVSKVCVTAGTEQTVWMSGEQGVGQEGAFMCVGVSRLYGQGCPSWHSQLSQGCCW